MTAALGHQAREHCSRIFGAPVLVASAPGRVNLIGGHTDYNEGLVLPVAIDRRTAVAARPRSDETIRVYSAAYDETVTFAPDDPTTGGPDWADYPKAVVRALGADLSLVGADLAITSTVTQRAGLASSAALEVGIAFALGALAEQAPEHNRRTIARACHRAEREFVGVDCGPMDQLTAASPEAPGVLRIDCRTGETVLHPLDPSIALLVVDSRVERRLADSKYNRRRQECERGVDRLADRIDGVSALRDVSVPEFTAHAGDLPGPIRSRCRHVVHENARVCAAVVALQSGAIGRVGALMGDSHESLATDFDVSCPELDLLVDLLGREGAYGARMTGAGFGGSVVALVNRADAATIADAVTDEYERRTGIEADAYVCLPDSGARVERFG